MWTVDGYDESERESEGEGESGGQGSGWFGHVRSGGLRCGEACLRLHDRAHSEALWWRREAGKLGAKQGQRPCPCCSPGVGMPGKWG
jgi:hypothetical protein